MECNKLDEKVYSQNTQENYFESPNDIYTALAGMYAPMQKCCSGYEQAGHFILNGVSDEGSTNYAAWEAFENLSYSPTSPFEIADWWSGSYRAIAGANLIIDYQQKIEETDNTSGKTVAKAAVAEAKFWRAVNYFQLVQMFGGVPLRITQVKRADEANIPRNTEDEVYAQVIKDFEDAEQDLPATPPRGIASKWAATAYLAKVYLTKKDYAKSLAKASEVVNSGAYSLVPVFKDIFDPDKKNSSEDIFAIQYVRVDGQGMRIETLSNVWGITGIEKNVYPKYKADDVRKNTTFNDPSDSTSNQGKWLDAKSVSVDGAGNNFIVYRFADLILVKAEAENELNGPTSTAYAEINKIRTRAGLPNLTEGLTKDQFRDSVLLERNLELALEQVRWYDLKRTDRLKSTLIAAGKTWNDKFYLFPIPQSEIDASNGVITQNPGY